MLFQSEQESTTTTTTTTMNDVEVSSAVDATDSVATTLAPIVEQEEEVVAAAQPSTTATAESSHCKPAEEILNDIPMEVDEEESPQQLVANDSSLNGSSGGNNPETSQEEAQSTQQSTTSNDDNEKSSVEVPSQSQQQQQQLPLPLPQLVPYAIDDEPMDVDEDDEPPTQSEMPISSATNNDDHDVAPTQSFDETDDNANKEDGFPTQSYEVSKPDDDASSMMMENLLPTDNRLPTQSNNDVGIIGTSCSAYANNSMALNDDETASSSYVPGTPERDQDQESAISTSSYEIAPCDELSIASSSVTPDNGIADIPTSTYNMNPVDSSSSTRVDSAVPTSSYEDHVILEQSVSTSYQVAAPPAEERTTTTNEATTSDFPEESYYGLTGASSGELTTNSLGDYQHDHQVETQSSQEASQSYFASSGEASEASFYNRTEVDEATQSSYYSTHQQQQHQQHQQHETSSSQQQSEATPTYTESYPPVEYSAMESSNNERHDLVESSSARPAER